MSSHVEQQLTNLKKERPKFLQLHRSKSSEYLIYKNNLVNHPPVFLIGPINAISLSRK